MYRRIPVFISFGLNFSTELADCAIRPALIDAAAIANDIRCSRHAGAQIVVVFLHVGIEYRAEIEPGLKALVLQLASAGADAVVCAHPHVVRPGEWLAVGSRRVFAHYSLGNLLSWHADSRYNQGELLFLFFDSARSGYRLNDVKVVKVSTQYVADLRKYLVVAF